ncbi:hypothetical protein ACFOLJ_19535 [Rugamonas sp. CCM 8940]|uniref:hypothetical protein n=1 Tax=Rugamonas sp. CCM 8940 TaxID=2765359 RepID=UPI0018F4BA85|nr:hypothetical protein [Rugamonas sp. CCM 8940]MBJ7312300.1 hypothetical protein [Rugamonas sp. CCM 8940]
MNEVQSTIDGVMTGHRHPNELKALLSAEARANILQKSAAEFYRLQHILIGAPQEHPGRQGAPNAMTELSRLIAAVGGSMVRESPGDALLERHWVIGLDQKPIADNVVIAW